MKGLICACVLMLVAKSTTIASESLAALYNRGNEHYRVGNFEGAISAYERVLAQGMSNGEVYYNLGNAYFKDNKLGRAILSYERALKLMPGDEDVLANLGFANAQKIDREDPVEDNMLTKVLRAVYEAFSINALAWMLCFFIFALAGVAVAWIFVPLRRILWGGLAVVLVVGLMFSGSLLAFKVHQHNIPHGVVLAKEVIGRSGPGPDFLQVFTLHEGAKVQIERIEGGWYLVKVRAGLGGWLESSALEGI